MRVRRSRLVKPWGSSRWMSRACKSVDPGVAETEPGYAGAVAGDDRRGELGECLGAADRVVADALDAQEAPVGGEADLPQGGQVVGAQPVGQSEVAGVVGRPVGQPTNRSARFIHRTGAPVTV